MKYEVIRPWHGVRVGQIVNLDRLHPALKANVRALRGEAQYLDATDNDGVKLVPATPGDTDLTPLGDPAPAAQVDQGLPSAVTLVPATPTAPSNPEPMGAGERKALFAARLKELGIKFDGRGSADDLAALLPPGEMEALISS